MTDVLVARGGFADDTALLRLHRAAGLDVRTVEADLSALRGEQIGSLRRSRPACIVFAAGDGSHLVDRMTLGALPKLTSDHPDVAFIAVLDETALRHGTAAFTSSVEAASPISRVRGDALTVARVALLESGADEVVCFSLPPAELAARVGAVIRRVRKARVGRAGPPQRMGDVIRGEGAPLQHPPWVSESWGNPADASSVGAAGGDDATRPWVDPARRDLVAYAGRCSLTAKEATLMGLLVLNDRVVTRDELGASLWTGTWCGSAKAIDMHVANLRRKLATVSAGTWRIDTVRGVGFVLTTSYDVEVTPSGQATYETPISAAAR